MTLYEFVKHCLEKEAVRTEPDVQPMLQKVLKEIEKWKKNN